MYNIVKSLIYNFLRALANASLSFCYRNIIVSGYDDIKNRKPTLFVSNHQNTFLDGIVLVQVAPNFSPNVLVRADIFKSKWAALALDMIRLIPIYRKRDNMGTVAQNNDVFKKCITLFQKDESVLIFPEGNHAIKRFLRPLQKGAARIAFQAEEEDEFQLGLNVIPFGLHYESHPNRWYDLHVHFGEAFQARDFQSEFAENPTQAQKQMIDKIQAGISAEMIDIRWHAEYEFMEQVRVLIKPYAMDWAANKKSIVHAENELVNRLAGRLQENETATQVLKEQTYAYFEEVRKYKLSEDFTAKKSNIFVILFKVIKLLVGLPFWLMAKVVNFVPEYIIERKVIPGVKDLAWHISLRAGVSLFLYPIYYLMFFLILGFSFDWILAGVIVFTFPLISVAMYESQYHFKKLRNAMILWRQPDILKKEQDLVQEFKGLL